MTRDNLEKTQNHNQTDLEIVVEEQKALLKETVQNLQKARSELNEAKAIMFQQEKLASIGQMAAGVAHEINNPIGFVSSNIESCKSYQNDLLKLLKAQDELLNLLKSKEDEELIISAQPSLKNQFFTIESIKDSIDLNYLLEDIPVLLKESEEGLERVKRIVEDLKDFIHPGKEESEYANINSHIDSTINIASNELKYKATIKKEYGNLPDIECYPHELNQVFLNLLVNAGHAIEKKGTIKIKTWIDGEHVLIQFSDTGHGIPEKNLSRIFDSFFYYQISWKRNRSWFESGL